MTENKIHLHLGIDREQIPDLRHDLGGLTRVFERGRPDGGHDSWTDWGEPVESDDAPVHVIVEYPGHAGLVEILGDLSYTIDQGTDLKPMRGSGTIAVVTDAEVWSKQFYALERLPGED